MPHTTARERDRRRQAERFRQKQVVADIRAWINWYKTEQGCVDCGFNRWPEALQFDHLDRATKQRSLGWYEDKTKLHSRARAERFKAHVQRYCVVRCANCHAHRSKTEEHWRRVSTSPAHGEPTLF